jgi:cysteine-rich repeat protein
MPNVNCGNLLVEAGEQCDDGNTTAGDGCSASCQAEPAVCGNSKVEPGEQCDDGNSMAGDNCDAACQLETGTVCGDAVDLNTALMGGIYTGDTTGKGNVPTSTAGARAKAALAKVTISDVVDAPESTETKTKKGHKIKQPTTFTTTQIDWACDGLTHLSAVCDGAVTQDGCGFNGTDSHFGRSLASSVQNGGLSSKQLEFAVKMLKKYHGQIGAFPS